jgi:HlyD family secretion protein
MAIQVSPRRMVHVAPKASKAARTLLVLAILAVVASLGGLVFAVKTDRLNNPFVRKVAKTIPGGITQLDRGPIHSFIVESGTLESPSNATVICEVEAVLGTVGGSTGGGMGGGGGGGGRSGSGGGSGAGATSPSGTMAGGTRGYGLAGATGAAAAGSSLAGAAGMGSGSGMGGSTAAAGSGGSGAAGGGGAGGGGGGGAGGSMASSGAAGSTRPVIASFSYRVTPHTPLRGSTATTTTQALSNRNNQQMSGMGGGGGGGGGGMGGEKPGSTRIISILPEGTAVKAGELVCELDSAAFRDEVAVQLVRYAQAESWLHRAETSLVVAEMELRQYRDGVMPQDIRVLKQYIQNCLTDQEQKLITLEWSLDMQRQGLRSGPQVLGDRLAEERTRIALDEAREMQRRLLEFTAPRILKSLEAKIEAVRSDLLSQKSAFQVEEERLRRLERAVEKCKLVAPEDGVVVYARNTNGWGRVEDEIKQGSTVREGQALFKLPDPKNMSIIVKISESKIAALKTGMKALVHVDALPERPLRGTLREIKPIPTKASMVSDVNLYTATVTIDGSSSAELRTGMSAEVAFLAGDREDVVRVPVTSVRWIDGKPFVAVVVGESTVRWQPVTLGLSSTTYAEVLSGLDGNERVASQPMVLDVPTVSREAPLVAAAIDPTPSPSTQ